MVASNGVLGAEEAQKVITLFSSHYEICVCAILVCVVAVRHVLK